MSVTLTAMAIEAALAFGAGIAIGILHFRLLWWNARLFVRAGSALAATALQLARFGVLGLVLFVMAKSSAAVLLAGGLGLLIARHIVIRRIGATE